MKIKIEIRVYDETATCFHIIFQEIFCRVYDGIHYGTGGIECLTAYNGKDFEASESSKYILKRVYKK